MWDGRVFETHDESLQISAMYHKDNFEVRTLEQDGKFLVYTRRAVKETVATNT
jgi:hypothetical protein